MDPAAPGIGTRILVSPLIFRRSPISSRSNRAPTGRGPTPPGHELKAYAEHCVDKYGLRPKIRFNTKVLGAGFDDGPIPGAFGSTLAASSRRDSSSTPVA